MAALRQLAVPTVKVRRGGQVVEISASKLVPGDIVLLETVVFWGVEVEKWLMRQGREWA